MAVTRARVKNNMCSYWGATITSCTAPLKSLNFSRFLRERTLIHGEKQNFIREEQERGNAKIQRCGPGSIYAASSRSLDLS